MIQELHSLIFTQRTQKLIPTQKPMHRCLQQFYSLLQKTWKQKCPAVGKWINLLRYIQTMKYFIAKKRCTTKLRKRHGGTFNVYQKWKNLVWTGFTQYHSSLTFWKRQNYWDSKKTSGWFGSGMNRWSREDIYGSETICMLLSWWLHVTIHLL